jgi:DNA-binding CsgD family transcriptional regulator
MLYAALPEVLPPVDSLVSLVASSARAASFRGCDVWPELKAGRRRIVLHFWTDAQYYLLLAAGDGEAGQRASKHDHSILEGALLSTSQKCVCVDLGLSPSSVATNCRRSLAELGLDCLPSKVPFALFSLIQAANDGLDPPGLKLLDLELGACSYRVVSIQRPEKVLSEVLSRAELEVLTRLVEGYSHAQIANERGASRRTVANQTSSAFRRLGVSGRTQLLRLLALDAARLRHPDDARK